MSVVTVLSLSMDCSFQFAKSKKSLGLVWANTDTEFIKQPHNTNNLNDENLLAEFIPPIFYFILTVSIVSAPKLFPSDNLYPARDHLIGSAYSVIVDTILNITCIPIVLIIAG
jgi:hypothetical protein